MRTVFHARLVNDRFGDPALYIDIPDDRRALLFDCGRIDELSPRELLKVTDIFVSHCHIDHWTGFDRVLRVFVGREKVLRLFGPPGFIDRVLSRIDGYTWNLLSRMPNELVLVIVEYHPDGSVRMTRTSTAGGLVPDPVIATRTEGGLLLRDPRFDVRCAVLDHRTPCLAFALEERGHIGVLKNVVEAMGFGTGKWLGELKRAVRAGTDPATIMRVNWKDEGIEHESFAPLGELRRCLHVTRGQKLCYVVDARFDRANAEAILALCADAEQLYIEAAFLHREAEHAYDRYHLTARQAGDLARRARATRVYPFHFSARHETEEAALESETRDAFAGVLEPLVMP